MRAKSSSVFTSFSSRTLLRCEQIEFARARINRRCPPVQHLLQRTQHQGQRRAEFVAHIAEECCLGAIEFGQSLRPPALFFIGARLSHGVANLAGQKIEEGPIARVEFLVRIDSGNDQSDRARLSGDRDRQHQAGLDARLPSALRQRPQAEREIFDQLQFRIRGCRREHGALTAVNRSTCGQAGSPAWIPTVATSAASDLSSCIEVEAGKRNIVRIRRQGLAAAAGMLLPRFSPCCCATPDRAKSTAGVPRSPAPWCRRQHRRRRPQRRIHPESDCTYSCSNPLRDTRFD